MVKIRYGNYIPISWTINRNDKAEDVSYNDRVNELIRRRYSLSEELAILRQRDEKQEDFAEYYGYAEQCKQEAKGK